MKQNLGAGETILPLKERESKHKWMKDSILELMTKRLGKSAENKALSKKIQEECRRAKEKWIESQSRENLEKKNI